MKRLPRLILAILGLVLSSAAPRAQTPDVIVFAAASLKNALDAIAADFQSETGKRVAISYAASSALARQIEQGAPADLFISADLDWMDYLQPRGLIRAGEPAQPARQPHRARGAGDDGAGPVDLRPGALAAALGGGRLATAAVASRAGRQIRQGGARKLGLWGEVVGPARGGRERARRPHLRGARRGAARHRLRHRRAGPSRRSRSSRASPRRAIRRSSIPRRSRPAPRRRRADASCEALRTPASAAIFAREGFIPLD